MPDDLTPAPPSVLRMVQCEPGSRALKRVRLDVTTGAEPAWPTHPTHAHAPAFAFAPPTPPTRGLVFSPPTPPTEGFVFPPPFASPAPLPQGLAALAGTSPLVLGDSTGRWPWASVSDDAPSDALEKREPGHACNTALPPEPSTPTAGASRGLESDPHRFDAGAEADDSDDGDGSDDSGVPIVRSTLPLSLPFAPVHDGLSNMTAEELEEMELDPEAADEEARDPAASAAATRPREEEDVGEGASAGAAGVPPPSRTPPLRLIVSASDMPPLPLALDPMLAQEAHDVLEADSHRLHQELAARTQSDTSTAGKYEAIVRNYSQWWAVYQADLLAQRKIQVAVPAFPITATKVTFFLEHEMTREKRKPGSTETIPGSSLGKSHIASVISALEHRRLNDEYKYRAVPEAQRSLRSDKRIKDAERSSRHNEPKRVHTANTLKASGTSSDAYTPPELQMCSLWCLSESKTRSEVFRGIRDRAMLLVSAGTAFRGDSARMVQWSDLFLAEVPLQEVRQDFLLPVLGVYSDNAKHNQLGRVDESGMVRHRIVELCPVGAAAFLFWAHFHVLERPPPDFAPDFTDKNVGPFGRRDWYNAHLFYAIELYKQMSYDNHYDRIKRIHEGCQVSLTKVTHATRHFGAQNARNHGASVTGTKALGGWSDSGSYRACYDRLFPLDALLGAAMFNGRDPSSYFLARDTLDPPPDLLLCVFPWIEDQQRALAARQAQNRLASDIALYQFLRVLTWFRRVLLQDAAVLFCRYPSLPLFCHAPFNGARFREYAVGADRAIAAAELQARCAFEGIPETLVGGFRALLTEQALARERDAANQRAQYQDVVQKVAMLQGTMEVVAASRQPSRSSRKTRASTAAADATTAAAATIISAAAAGPVAAAVPTAPAAISATIPASQPSAAGLAPPYGLTPATAVPASSGAAAPWLPSNPIPVTTPDPRMETRNRLAKKYGEDHVARHEWRLVNNQLVPLYALQAVKTVSDVWTEYTLGLNDFLPVRELEENWGAKWRMNISSIKTEWSRRKPVIGLISELADKPRWSVDLALRFLQTAYKSYTARSFYEYIKKAENRREVIERSDSFP